MGLVLLAGCACPKPGKPGVTSGPFTVYAVPVTSGGSNGACHFAYVGCVNYTKTVAQGWGWKPDTNMTVHTAADGGGRTDTLISYVGKTGDSGCNQTSVTVPDPPASTAYRFTIFFPNNVPATNYPIILNGFNP